MSRDTRAAPAPRRILACPRRASAEPKIATCEADLFADLAHTRATFHMHRALTLTVVQRQTGNPHRAAPRDDLQHILEDVLLQRLWYPVFVRGEEESEVGRDLFPLDCERVWLAREGSPKG